MARLKLSPVQESCDSIFDLQLLGVMTNPPIHVAAVTSDPDHKQRMLRALSATGISFEVTQFCQMPAVLERLTEKRFDLVLFDLSEAGDSGLAAVAQLRKSAPHLPVVGLTFGNGALAFTSPETGTSAFLTIEEAQGLSLVRSLLRAIDSSGLVSAFHETLWDNAERLSKVFRSCPAAIGYSTIDGRKIFDVNHCFLDFFGYGRGEVIGRSVAQLGLWAELNDRDHLIRTLRERGSVRSAICRLRRRSGETRLVHLSMETIRTSPEPLLNVMFTDVTDVKRMAQLDHTRATAQAKLTVLSARQRQVFNLLLVGMPNKVIARKLGLSERTVEAHRASVMRRLGAQSFAELVQIGVLAGPAFSLLE